MFTANLPRKVNRRSRIVPLRHGISLSLTSFDLLRFAIRATGCKVKAHIARFTAEGATTAQMAQALTDFATRPRGTFNSLMAIREAIGTKEI
jgi:hypothetical protein